VYLKAKEDVLGYIVRLSPREQQVLEMACQGLADKEIATYMGIERVTVRSYIARVCEKLGATNRTQLGSMAPRKFVREDPAQDFW
jgi:DNA-binding NarL/FixJ family response regulator